MGLGASVTRILPADVGPLRRPSLASEEPARRTSRLGSSDANESGRESAWLIPDRAAAAQNQAAMKLGLVPFRVRYRAALRASLAFVFSLQIVGLCSCLPATADEHDCCPPIKQGLNATSPSAQAATSCCPDGSGMRAVTSVTERDVRATASIAPTPAHARLVRNNVPFGPRHTGSAPLGSVSSIGRSPILRV